MLKRTLSQVALACAALSMGSAQAALTDGHFGASQIFDVQYYWNGNYLNASNFIAPYDMNFSHPTLGAGQYYAFFASTTNPGTYGLGIYNSNGTLSSVAHNTGTLQAIGPGAIFYIGSGFFGTVITTDAGYAYGSSASFGNMNQNPQTSDLTSYTWASTTPLAAGQSAPPPGSPAPSGPTTVALTNGGTYSNPSGTNLNPTGSGIVVASGSSATTITNAGTITASCTANATNCAGILANAASNVTITNSGDIVGGIYSGAATVLTNTGNISSANLSGNITGISQFGVRVQGDVDTIITNSGNITSTTSSAIVVNAIVNQSNGAVTSTVGGTINNSGTITGGAQGPGIAISNGATGVTVTNTGTITGGVAGIIAGPTASYTLNSSQAGLVVDYKLPTNFRTIINSTSSYGQLVMSANSFGSMNFGIYGGGVSGVPASTITNYTYVGVLQGVSSTNWANVTGTTGTYSGYNYSLVQDTNDTTKYNLLVAPSGPTVTGTNTSNTVTSTTANGAVTTTTSSSQGSPVVTTNVVTGSPVVLQQASGVVRAAQTATALTINSVVATSTITPTTTTTTTTTPVTVTTTTTTATNVTTTTTPVTVTTYSDNTQTTANGNPTTSTTAGAPIVTTSTAAGSPIVSQSVVVDNGAPVVTNTVTGTYATRIDGVARLGQSSGAMNNALTGGVAERFAAGENGIVQRTGAFGDEKQGWMYTIGEGTPGATSEGYKNKNGVYGLGYERLVKSDLLVGVNYAEGTSKLTGDSASGEVSKKMGTVYGLYSFKGWALNTTLGYSDNQFVNTHSISALSLQNSGTTTGTDQWLHNRVYTPAFGNFKLLAGVRTDQTKQAAFTETGAPITAMTYAKIDNTKTTSEYGVRWDKQVGQVMLGAEYSMSSSNLQTTTVMVGFTPRANIAGAIGVRNQRQDGIENNTVVTNITWRF